MKKLLFAVVVAVVGASSSQSGLEIYPQDCRGSKEVHLRNLGFVLVPQEKSECGPAKACPPENIRADALGRLSARYKGLDYSIRDDDGEGKLSVRHSRVVLLAEKYFDAGKVKCKRLEWSVLVIQKDHRNIACFLKKPLPQEISNNPGSSYYVRRGGQDLTNTQFFQINQESADCWQGIDAIYQTSLLRSF